MKLHNEELIEEFYNKKKEEYPNLSLEQMKDICFGPWKFLKDEMESGELPTVRLKYFGTFQVYKGRAEFMLRNLKERFEANKITEKQYFKLKKMLEKFLKNIQDGEKE